jgi:peptidoglycan-associated lipoprotein
MIKRAYFIGAVLLASLLSSCGANRIVNRGDKKFEREEYEAAIQDYQKALSKGQDAAMLNYKIAEAYRRSNRLPQAEPYYKSALDANLKKEDAFFYYGLALKANSRYSEATSQIESYLTVGTNRALVNRAKVEADNLKEVQGILDKSVPYEVINLRGLNTPASEFAPVVVDGELIFSSTRDGQTYAGNGEGFNDLFAYKSTSPTDTAGGTVRKFPDLINLPETHESSATFTPDGRTMVFARSNTGKRRGRQNVDLYVTQYKSEAWTEPKLISISDPNAWDASPAFGPDGRTLYFVSDRKGGRGGNDIYKTTLDANGRFSRPVSLGEDINTPGNDNFPRIGPDSTLYISSDGHPGLGMMDIFRIDENGKPVNLGVPINSAADDFAFFVADENMAYFSSNRAGGLGGDDIYLARKSDRKRVNLFVDGTVIQRQEVTTATTPVANIAVTLQDRQGNKLRETTTDAEGKFSFRLDSASTYSLVTAKEGFFTTRELVSTVGKIPPQSELTQPETDIRLTARLALTPIVKDKAIVVENIFYDLDKADIRPDAAAELDKLVQTLKDNPRISIELSSHTDVRGSEPYNMDLSQRRAQSAVDYIISQGIDPSRITAKGYGETRLVVPNAQTEEQHQVNRRTEFKVVRIQE